MRSGRCDARVFDDVITFSTQLGACGYIQPLSMLRTEFLFQCNLHTVLQSFFDFLFSYDSNVLRT